MRRLMATAAILFAATAPAAAQGRSVGHGNGHSGPASGSSAAPSATQAALATGSGSPTGVRQFGAWLDDASLLDPGGAWASISFGHYRTLGGSQTDFPVADGTVGVSPRIQVGGSVPYYRMTFTDGTNARGMGDVTLNAKFALVDPAKAGHKIGIAASSIIEVLEQAPPGGSRVGWGVPVNVEFRADGYRVYGSAGFFSRGAVFSSGALEAPLTERLTLTTALTLMRSTKSDPALDALGVPKKRVDVTGIASYFLRPSIAVFGGVGRTVSQMNQNATSLMVTGGLALTVVP
jgi:hypothetical protein